MAPAAKTLQGTFVQARATLILSKVECKRKFGSNWKTKVLIRQQVKYKKTLYGGYTTSVMYIIYVPSRLHHVSLTNLINILLYRQRYVTIKLSISHREDT